MAVLFIEKKGQQARVPVSEPHVYIVRLQLRGKELRPVLTLKGGDTMFR